jgi:hypothetical protein
MLREICQCVARCLSLPCSPAWSLSSGRYRFVLPMPWRVRRLADKNMVGPSLFGLIGRKSGSVAGFHYSAANKAADITWNADILDKYLTSPRDVVPGTIMTYAGLKDAGKRADLIAYLETLH